jgi:hypothetical protein
VSAGAADLISALHELRARFDLDTLGAERELAHGSLRLTVYRDGRVTASQWGDASFVLDSVELEP